MREGTKRHGHKALDDVFKKTQLDDKTIFDPQDAKELSATAKYEALLFFDNGKGTTGRED